ncbi:hypothetical protein ACFY8Q_07235 [[Kitasatospora] papulosa]|uniref:hypothetical protein n=1 Tax=[Kitasatospora] papulosa TaxID=1464011 RepID=UPI0036C8E2CE
MTDPTDAELIEHARAAGWHEPEKAPEFLAAYRAAAAWIGTRPVPQLANVEEQQRQAAAECAHSWTTALDGDDNPARDHTGRTWDHCGICGTRKPAPAAVPDRPALDLLTEIYEELGHDHRAPGLAAALLDQHARALADRITVLGKARGWSTWAADYIHPDCEFVDTGEDVEEPAAPSVGDRYVKRAAPDAGRTVTVNRVWTADDRHTAVAYEWHDPRASYAGSACPLDVFTRAYRAEAAR